MAALLLIPFSYAFLSRYREDMPFYLTIEYAPALLITLLFGKFGTLENLASYFVSFLAFISIYEIGYLVNDYVSIKWENKPRLRGVMAATGPLLVAWTASRLATFYLVSLYLAPRVGAAYWLFFAFLSLIFAAHNLLKRKEFKVCTFYWLSVCRFVCSTIWHVDRHTLTELLVAGTILYSGFRLLGYLESKELLFLPNRKSSEFRLLYYSLPLPLAVALALGGRLSPFPVLAGYYFLCAILATLLGRRSQASQAVAEGNG